MSTQWYYRHRGQEHGPVTASQLRDYADAGRIAPDDSLRRGELGQWHPAFLMTGLFSQQRLDQYYREHLDSDARFLSAISEPAVAVVEQRQTQTAAEPPGNTWLAIAVAVLVAAASLTLWSFRAGDRGETAAATAGPRYSLPSVPALMTPELDLADTPEADQIDNSEDKAVPPTEDDGRPALPEEADRPPREVGSVENAAVRPPSADARPTAAAIAEKMREALVPARPVEPQKPAQGANVPANKAAPREPAPAVLDEVALARQQARIAEHLQRFEKVAEVRRLLRERRTSLAAQMGEHDRQLGAANRELNRAQARVRQLQELIRQWVLRLRELEEDARSGRTVVGIAAVEVYLEKLEAALREAQARELALRGQMDAISNARQATEKEVQKIYGQANDLRNELLLLGDPAGKLTRAEHEAAVERLAEWILQDAKDDTALVTRGLAYLRLGNTLRARGDFEQAESLHVDAAGRPLSQSKGTSRPAAMSARAALLALGEERKESEALFDKALRLDDQDSFHYLVRALASWRQKDYGSAERYLKKYVELEPSDPEGLRLSALLYAACPRATVRDRQQALSHARRGCEITASKDWACLEALAAAYAESRQFEDALSVLEDARQLAAGENLAVLERRRQRYAAGEPLRLEQGPWTQGEE